VGGLLHLSAAAAALIIILSCVFAWTPPLVPSANRAHAVICWTPADLPASFTAQRAYTQGLAYISCTLLQKSATCQTAG
jgi:hypothetical protein